MTRRTHAAALAARIVCAISGIPPSSRRFFRGRRFESPRARMIASTEASRRRSWGNELILVVIPVGPSTQIFVVAHWGNTRTRAFCCQVLRREDLTTGDWARGDQAAACRADVLQLRRARRLPRRAERSRDGANASDESRELAGLEGGLVIRPGECAIEREVFLDYGGAESHGRQRHLDPFGMIRVSDGQAECCRH